MAIGLHVYQRPTEGEAYQMNLSNLAIRWRRTTRAIGGYWQGSFRLTEQALGWFGLQAFYNNFIGSRFVERTFGIDSWEGFIVEMRLIRQGQEHRRTLDPDWFHNRVQTIYSYPSSEDSEQGALTYNPVANSFRDASQDFSEWETLAGDATYALTVTNNDGTTAWGFMGAAFTTGGADDSIYVYEDVELGTAGWKGEVSGKTPSTYIVNNVTLSGSRQETAWGEDTDSSDIYGTLEYIISLGGATDNGATAIRDRELIEFAWPRSRKVGGGQVGTSVRDAPGTLEVSVAGFWATLNWQYRETSRVAAASDMITTIVGESEFVTAHRIESNDLQVKIDCEPTPQRIGDLCADVILQGDIDGNQWQGGVYSGRKFIYEAAPEDIEYYLRGDGTLSGTGGSVLSYPLFKPGVLVLDQRFQIGGIPAGAGGDRDDPRVAYIEECEWIADRNELRYKVQGQEESVTVLAEQLASGSFVASGES